MSDSFTKKDVEPISDDVWQRMLAETVNGSPNARRDTVLSDEEIDRIMGLPSGSERRTGKIAVAEPSTIGNGFTPSMRIVGETFTEVLARRIRHVVTGIVDVTFIDLSMVRISTSVGSLPLPSLLGVMQSRELSGSGIAVIDPALARAFFDVLLGGGQETLPDQPSSRPFSTIEVQLFRRLAETTALAFTEAFSEISKVEFFIDRVETNPRYVAMGKPTENAVRLRVQMQIGRRAGILEVLLPLAMFGGIEHLIQVKDDDGPAAADVDWRQHLVQTVATSSIEVEAVLAEFRLPLRKVMGLAVGQTIPLDLYANAPVWIQSGGNRLGQGLMGRSREHMAIRLSGPVTSQRRKREL